MAFFELRYQQHPLLFGVCVCGIYLVLITFNCLLWLTFTEEKATGSHHRKRSGLLVRVPWPAWLQSRGFITITKQVPTFNPVVHNIMFFCLFLFMIVIAAR